MGLCNVEIYQRMKYLITFLMVLAVGASAQETNVVDPMGNQWTPGTPQWDFWRGFGIGLLFMLFAWGKRIAKRSAGGSGSDF